MSSESATQEITEQPILNEVVESTNEGSVIGQVKWFSDKLGYGFVTINEGADKGKDIFVHHSGIKPANSNYKTLRKGEYVNFNIVKGINGLQGVDITGINGGPLMCDIVMGSRKIDGPPPPPARPGEWQTVGRRPFVPKGTKPVKNTAKYNKATRNPAASTTAASAPNTSAPTASATAASAPDTSVTTASATAALLAAAVDSAVTASTMIG